MSDYEKWLTDDVLSLIGKEATARVSPDVVTEGDIRRFVQAVMDDNPVHYDEEIASKSKYGGVAAPGSYPITFVGKRSPGSPDPLVEGEQGVGQHTRELHVPIPGDPRLFHGSSELEVRRLARPGERITMRTRLTDIHERTGRSGRLAFVVTEKTFTNQDGEVLCIERYTGVAMLGDGSGPSEEGR